MKLKTFWFNAINFVFRRERPNIYQYIQYKKLVYVSYAVFICLLLNITTKYVDDIALALSNIFQCSF